jgi:hypothetical protein
LSRAAKPGRIVDATFDVVLLFQLTGFGGDERKRDDLVAVKSSDRHHSTVSSWRAALPDDPQSPQQLVDIDGPADADALGREQAVVVRIPHPFVHVLPVPIDGHSHPRPLRNFVRVSLQIAHDDAPENVLNAR